MKANWWKYAILVAILVIGFFIGRCSVESKIEKVVTRVDTTYITLPEVIDTLVNPIPILVYRDTGSIQYYPREVIVKESVDTAKLLSDYTLVRSYSNKLFDNDSIGKLIVNSNIQYNRVKDLSYEFTPILREKTVETTKYVKVKRVEPYLGAGVMINSGNIIGQGGIFFKNKVGVGVLYQYDRDVFEHNFGLSIMLRL